MVVTTKSRELSWTAVRRGDTYCAPACGWKCTWKAFEKASTDAGKLAALLTAETGRTWEPSVWENLGWHYRAVDESGYWKIHANIRVFEEGGVRREEIDSYSAFFGLKDSVGGKWSTTGKTPGQAIARMQEIVAKETREMEVMFEASKFLGMKS